MRFLLLLLSALVFLCSCQQTGSVDLVALSEQARSGDDSACRQLVGMLGHEENALGDKVYPMVVEIGQPMVAALMASVETENRGQRERVIAALGTLRVQAALQPISEVLRRKSLKRRYIAAWALGEIGDPTSIQPLMSALGDPEDLVRHYATRALIKFNRKAVEPLIDFLGTAEPLAAGGAIRALGDIGDKRCLDALLLKVDGPNRKDAYLALGKLRDRKAETALIDGLADTDWQVRMNAAMALGPIGSERSVAALNKTLVDEVIVVREWSARSLSIILGKTVKYTDNTGKRVEPYSVYH